MSTNYKPGGFVAGPPLVGSWSNKTNATSLPHSRFVILAQAVPTPDCPERTIIYASDKLSYAQMETMAQQWQHVEELPMGGVLSYHPEVTELSMKVVEMLVVIGVTAADAMEALFDGWTPFNPLTAAERDTSNED